MVERMDPLGLTSGVKVETHTAIETSAWELNDTENCPNCKKPMESVSAFDNSPASVCMDCRVVLPRKD